MQSTELSVILGKIWLHLETVVFLIKKYTRLKDFDREL